MLTSEQDQIIMGNIFVFFFIIFILFPCDFYKKCGSLLLFCWIVMYSRDVISSRLSYEPQTVKRNNWRAEWEQI